MKKAVLLILGFALLAASCVKEDFKPNRNDLIGTWLNGGTQYRYDASNWEYTLFDSTKVWVNGARWTITEDVQESEAQPFSWTLTGADITLVHRMYMGGAVPKTYTILSLDANVMKWKDSYGNVTIFTKVK